MGVGIVSKRLSFNPGVTYLANRYRGSAITNGVMKLDGLVSERDAGDCAGGRSVFTQLPSCTSEKEPIGGSLFRGDPLLERIQSQTESSKVIG